MNNFNLWVLKLKLFFCLLLYLAIHLDLTQTLCLRYGCYVDYCKNPKVLLLSGPHWIYVVQFRVNQSCFGLKWELNIVKNGFSLNSENKIVLEQNCFPVTVNQSLNHNLQCNILCFGLKKEEENILLPLVI